MTRANLATIVLLALAAWVLGSIVAWLVLTIDQSLSCLPA